MNRQLISSFRSGYDAFAHLQAEKVELYRLILGIFTLEKERFAISIPILFSAV